MGNWLPSRGYKPASQSDRVPAGVCQISRNSFYEFCCPLKGKPEMDIIFFHGLQPFTYADACWKTFTYPDACWKTWREEQKIWPQNFLTEEFPQCRVLSLCYDSCVRQSVRRGRLDMSLIGKNLVQIILDYELADVGNRPVILVGHSLGGLVIKQFLMHTSKLHTSKLRDERPLASSGRLKLDKFLDEYLIGIFNYATPHGGSKVGRKYLKKVPENGPVKDYLRVLSKEAPRLNNDFRNWRLTRGRRIPVSSIAEGKPTSLGGMISAIIVDENAVRQDTDELFTDFGSDHINVCKPETKNFVTFYLLRKFIKEEVSRKYPVTEGEETASEEENK